MAAVHPDSVSRPAGQACPGPGTGHDKRARDDDQQTRRAAGRRPERRLDDLRLPDLGHARLRRARLADRALDRAPADIPAGRTGWPRVLAVAGDLPVRAVLGALKCAGQPRAWPAAVTAWAA